MNNMRKDIYNGLNPIYESLMSEEKTDTKGDKVKQANDAISTVATILNTVFSILLSSKMENAKTARGFQEIKNKMIGTNNFGAFRQYVLSLVESLGAMDIAQKDAYRSNIQFLTGLFSQIEPLMADEKTFKSAKNDIVAKLLNNFEEDLKQREAQIRKTSPTLLSQAVKAGQVVKEAKKDVDETDAEDEAGRGRAFNKSRDSIDSALAFVGDVDRDKYTPALKDNGDIKRYKDIADGLYKKAQDLQMLDRKGGKIVTTSGEIKRGEYMKQQDSLINEIIRQKREYKRVKDAIMKTAGLTPPPVVDPVCPPGKKFDTSKGICVDAATGTAPAPTTTQPKPTAACTFPVKVGTKCTEIGNLQSKLMELLPSAKQHLSKKGGSDKVYGKGTASVSNIVWGYLSGNFGQALTSDLTKEMFDAIMALKPEDIDLDVPAAAIKDSRQWEMSVAQKIQEREEIKKSSVLSFADFFDVIEESYSFAKMDEDTEAAAALKKLKDSCVKDSLAQGKVVDCSAISKKEDEKKEDEKKEEKLPPTREEWSGLKYVQTGSYPVSFDESLLSAWTKEIAITAISFAIPGSGYIAKAGSTALRGLAIRGAEKVGAEKLAQKLAQRGVQSAVMPMTASVTARQVAKRAPSVVANQLSNISKGFFAKYGKVLIPKRIAAGLIGGTVGGAALDFISGRNSYVITVTEGYIERSNLLGVINGLIDTIDGYVSDDDWATIATVMAVIKGSFTIDEEGQAVSSWAFIKDRYQAKEGETIMEDISSVKPKMGDVEGFPRLKSSSPLSSVSDIAWDFAKDELVSFVSKIESNEGKLKENLAKLPKNYLEALEEGEYAEYDEEGNVEGVDLETGEETETGEE